MPAVLNSSKWNHRGTTKYADELVRGQIRKSSGLPGLAASMHCDRFLLRIAVLASMEIQDNIRRTCALLKEEEPGHIHDHIRNILALLLREVCTCNSKMSPDEMRSYIYGLADQAYREDHRTIFEFFTAPMASME
jgi:hypothetical protein